MRSASTNAALQVTGDHGGCSPETNLWLAVLEQVISTEGAEQAHAWLRSRDGRLVAAMAGVDADWVSDKLLPACQSTARRRDTRHLFASDARRVQPRARRAPAGNVPGQTPWAASWSAC